MLLLTPLLMWNMSVPLPPLGWTALLWSYFSPVQPLCASPMSGTLFCINNPSPKALQMEPPYAWVRFPTTFSGQLLSVPWLLTGLEDIHLKTQSSCLCFLSLSLLTAQPPSASSIPAASASTPPAVWICSRFRENCLQLSLYLVIMHSLILQISLTS